MRKNESGIALTALAIAIMVMIILASITIEVGNIIEKSRIQNLATNMLLIQTKVKIINERFDFNQDASIYVGKKLKEQADKTNIANGVLTSEELQSDSIYIFDRATLNSIGLEGIKLGQNEVFIVNYDTCEVIWPKGQKNEDGVIVHRLTEIME